MSGDSLPLGKNWRPDFLQALSDKDADRFEGLLADHADRVVRAGGLYTPWDPLRVAVQAMACWGVQRLVSRPLKDGQGVKQDWIQPAVLKAFFARARPSVSPEPAVLEVWEALLPAILASVPARQQAVAFYLDALNHTQPLPQALHWDSLRMDCIGEGLWHLGYHLESPQETMTPLQRAWRAGNIEAMERLLDHGVSPSKPDASSLLPEWTLRRAVADMHPDQLWPEWNGVVARLRAMDLEERLPGPVQKKASSPRF